MSEAQRRGFHADSVKEEPKAEVQEQVTASPEAPQQAEPQRVSIPVWRHADARKVLNPVPGRRYYWLNADEVKKGNTRGWNTDHGPNNPMKAKSANPNSKQLTHGSVTPAGTEVRSGTMVLGWMPEEDAVERNKYYQDRGNAPIRDLQDLKEATEAKQEELREKGISPDLVKVTGGVTMNRRF